jgi:hypothetical protein
VVSYTIRIKGMELKYVLSTTQEPLFRITYSAFIQPRDVKRVDGPIAVKSQCVLSAILPMLVLDATTLFFYSLSAPAASNKKLSGLIKDWAADVQAKDKSSKQQKVSVPSSAIGSTTLAPRTSALSRTTSSNNVRTSGASELPSTVVDLEVHGGVNDLGGLFDEDESYEREAAMSSPIKGLKRLTSTARIYLNSSLS